MRVTLVDPLIGAEVDRYRITRLLGEGGMGQVYLAEHGMIGSRVAIKVLSAECTRSPELLERFFAEARAVNLIKHENIVSVLDMATLPDGRPYIMMEFIEGRTLGAIVRAGDAPLGGVVQVMSEVLSALAAAHTIGIVHRDLKPDNILVTAEGHAKVLDFGIAKLAPGIANAMSPRTRTGALLGTPAYMAPEQISGAGNVDARTDLYAAGIVLFEAVTGRVPFTGDTLYDLMRAHLEQTPPSPRFVRPELPAGIEDVILTALAKAPEQRFQSAQAMSMALHHASRELSPDHWRALSSRGGTHPRPSFEHMAMSPSQPGHASVVRSATPVPTGPQLPAPPPPPLEGKPTPDRPRGRAGLVVGGLAALGLTAAIVALALRRDADPPPPPPPVVVANEPAPIVETPVPARVPASPPADAAPAPVPSTPAPTRTRTNAPPPARVASPPVDAGPTIIGGGSAADHDVHVGENVQHGPNTVIGSNPSPPTKNELTLPIDYNPRAFDGAAYAKTALAHAKKIYPDAGLVRYDIVGVLPSGLTKLSGDDSSYLFRSRAKSVWPAGVPKNAEVEIACYVEVTVTPHEITVRARDYSLDAACNDPIRPLPRCTHAQVWAMAKQQGADPDTTAKISFLSDGKWFFDNDGDDYEGLIDSFADVCK